MTNYRNITDLYQYNCITTYTKMLRILFAFELIPFALILIPEDSLAPIFAIAFNLAFQFMFIMMQFYILLFVKKSFVNKLYVRYFNFAQQDYSYKKGPMTAFALLHLACLITSIVLVVLDVRNYSEPVAQTILPTSLIGYIFGLLYIISFKKLKNQLYKPDELNSIVKMLKAKGDKELTLRLKQASVKGDEKAYKAALYELRGPDMSDPDQVKPIPLLRIDPEKGLTQDPPTEKETPDVADEDEYIDDNDDDYTDESKY